MGWTVQKKPENVKKFLIDKFTWKNSMGTESSVEDCKIVAFNVAYLAVTYKSGPNVGTGAVVVYLDYNRPPPFTFAWKAIDETAYPFATQCPTSILDLLDSTSDKLAYEEDIRCAQRWRDDCRKNAIEAKERRARIKAVQVGTVIRFERDIHVKSGKGYRDFTCLMRGAFDVFKPKGTGWEYQIKGWRNIPFKIIKKG